MNIRDCAAMAAAVAFGLAGAGHAATFVVNQTIDVTNFGGMPGEASWIGNNGMPDSRIAPEANVTLGVGDTLDWTVTFVGGLGGYIHAINFNSIAARLTIEAQGLNWVGTTGHIDLLDYLGAPIGAGASTSAPMSNGLGNIFSVSDFVGVPSDLKFYGYHYVGTLDSLPDGVDSETFKYAVFSMDGAVVPEPATWAVMIAGFGMVGAALRRQRLLVLR